MQSMILDPDRPHGLDDILDRMSTESPWTPSWADICRVQAYVGDEWQADHSNAYEVANLILYHLEDVRRAYVAVKPYLAVTCTVHNAAISDPCAYASPLSHIWGFNKESSLARTPLVCTWRVLARHNLLSALEIFRSHLPASSAGHDILSLSAEHPYRMRGNTSTEFEIARVQYRHPQPLTPERIVGMGDWVIHDLRIGGKSVLEGHLDLPGALFHNSTLGPHLLLPVIEQDQWVEIEARPAHQGQNLWFRAAIVGTIYQENDCMNISTDADFLKKSQELQEQQAVHHLAACERIRKKLELPIEALTLIDKVLRDGSTPELIGGFRTIPPGGPFPSAATRSPLRLVSEQKIKPTDPITGKPTAVHVRPYTLAMRVEEIEILSSPNDWMIADVQVGTRSQFPQAGPPLPGRLFTPGGTCHHFVTDAIQTGMDFRLLVHYVGSEAGGSIFEAVAMGSQAA